MWNPIRLGRKRNKYKNTKVVINGVKYDSKFEASELLKLKKYQEYGLIKDLIFKPKYEFIVNGEPIKYVGKKRSNKLTYTADAKYYDNKLRQTVVVDIKGFETAVFKIKRALMKSINGIEVQLITK